MWKLKLPKFNEMNGTTFSRISHRLRAVSVAAILFDAKQVHTLDGPCQVRLILRPGEAHWSNRTDQVARTHETGVGMSKLMLVMICNDAMMLLCQWALKPWPNPAVLEMDMDRFQGFAAISAMLPRLYTLYIITMTKFRSRSHESSWIMMNLVIIWRSSMI